MITDFAKLLQKYFMEYLPETKGLSNLTIKNYSQTIKLFAVYLNENVSGIDNIKLLSINKDTVVGFLAHYEKIKKWAPSTRNNRLAGIKSFFKFSANENEKYRLLHQKIQSIPRKKQPRGLPTNLSPKELTKLLSQPNSKTQKGQRHLLILATLYDSGARVQELIDLTPSSFNFNNGGRKVKIIGKGRKSRIIDLSKNVVNLLKEYIDELGLNDLRFGESPLFLNHSGKKLTRNGVNYIVKKYSDLARIVDPNFPKDVSCHTLRHTKAVHLVEIGWTLVDIMLFLGHESPKTTMIYINLGPSTRGDILKERSNQLTSGIITPRFKFLDDKASVIKFLQRFN